jgi:hypothetical protein
MHLLFSSCVASYANCTSNMESWFAGTASTRPFVTSGRRGFVQQEWFSQILTEKCSGTKPMRNLPAILEVDVEK